MASLFLIQATLLYHHRYKCTFIQRVGIHGGGARSYQGRGPEPSSQSLLATPNSICDEAVISRTGFVLMFSLLSFFVSCPPTVTSSR